MNMNRAGILGITENVDHANLLGAPVDTAMLKELNRRLMSSDSINESTSADIPSPVQSDILSTAKYELNLEQKLARNYQHPVLKETSQMIEISHMAISIFGNDPADAYLHVEFIVKGNELSPLMCDVGLNGSSFRTTFNKDFSNLDFQPRKVLLSFFTELSSWFSFTGTAAPVRDGLLSNLNSKLKNCLGGKSLCFTKVEIFAVSIASSFQVELTSTEGGKKLLIMLPAAKLGYQMAEDTSKFCDSYESYDTYDLIDDHFYGDLKDTLSYFTKAELLKIFRDLSKLYAFSDAFSVLISMN